MCVLEKLREENNPRKDWKELLKIRGIRQKAD
jgi:hypothetical protein